MEPRLMTLAVLYAIAEMQRGRLYAARLKPFTSARLGLHLDRV